jgi:hypothetical protein
MKNIQIIDGAVNSTFQIYQVTDEDFQLIFPKSSDIAFQNDLEQTQQSKTIDQIWEFIFKNKVDKKYVAGIHGTLHLSGSNCLKVYYPTHKEEEVLQFYK